MYDGLAMNLVKKEQTMISNPYAGQFEQQVLSADPIELVSIMFDHLVASVVEARQHLIAGDRVARGRSIAKAFGLLGELSRSLDMERGGELAHTLRQLYAFVADRLVQAQTQQIEEPLVEAAETLRPLRDAWKELDQARSDEMPVAFPMGAPEAGSGSGLMFGLSA
jgi:flagellar protein FliS